MRADEPNDTELFFPWFPFFVFLAGLIVKPCLPAFLLLTYSCSRTSMDVLNDCIRQGSDPLLISFPPFVYPVVPGPEVDNEA